MPPPEYGIWFRAYLDDILGVRETTAFKARSPEKKKVEGAIMQYILTWCFCETATGRFGQVLPSVKLGDRVCILYGGELTYVIRLFEDGRYMFVGGCYVHGLMDGEVCAMGGVEDREFCFC